MSHSNPDRRRLPANAPAKQFWAFTIYNVRTRSMLQTDQRFPEMSSNDEALKQNSDGSYDVYFAPTAPKGMEGNWIQTWRPSEAEMVE